MNIRESRVETPMCRLERDEEEDEGDRHGSKRVELGEEGGGAEGEERSENDQQEERDREGLSPQCVEHVI